MRVRRHGRDHSRAEDIPGRTSGTPTSDEWRQDLEGRARALSSLLDALERALERTESPTRGERIARGPAREECDPFYWG